LEGREQIYYVLKSSDAITFTISEISAPSTMTRDFVFVFTGVLHKMKEK
jgi:hypothetical protein